MIRSVFLKITAANLFWYSLQISCGSEIEQLMKLASCPVWWDMKNGLMVLLKWVNEGLMMKTTTTMMMMKWCFDGVNNTFSLSLKLSAHLPPLMLELHTVLHHHRLHHLLPCAQCLHTGWERLQGPAASVEVGWGQEQETTPLNFVQFYHHHHHTYLTVRTCPHVLRVCKQTGAETNDNISFVVVLWLTSR